MLQSACSYLSKLPQTTPRESFDRPYQSRAEIVRQRGGASNIRLPPFALFHRLSRWPKLYVLRAACSRAGQSCSVFAECKSYGTDACSIGLVKCTELQRGFISWQSHGPLIVAKISHYCALPEILVELVDRRLHFM
jgi:hypothetical protein